MDEKVDIFLLFTLLFSFGTKCIKIQKLGNTNKITMAPKGLRIMDTVIWKPCSSLPRTNKHEILIYHQVKLNMFGGYEGYNRVG